MKNCGEGVKCAEITALLLLYYCFTTAILLLYYLFWVKNGGESIKCAEITLVHTLQ
jgi:hypothetical protein